ncbi:MAG TPA: metalloregulator ArsR/SmtB family transcription factor [Tepidisphaeraceae bacterium]|jgi:DNA-binding transcriptional ArsR family regulator
MTLIQAGIGDVSTDGGALERLTALFRLLSDKTRLSIVVLLGGGERNVTTLCQDLRLPQPTVSHHLGLLRESGVVANRRSGKQVFYHLSGHIEGHAEGAATAGDGQLGIRTGPFFVRIDRTGESFSIDEA